MSFWSQTDSSIMKDPKRKFRFKVEFSNMNAEKGGGGSTMWFAKTVNKPSFTINAAEHKYLNHTFYYPGNVTWNEVTLALVDPTEPDAAALLADFLVDSGYAVPTDPTMSEEKTISKAKSAGALGAVTISQINADGTPIEAWTLQNAWISDVKFGDLEYGADDLVQIDLTLKYDWATLTPIDGSPRFSTIP